MIGTFAAPPMVGNVGFSSLHGFIYLANPPTGDPREVDSDGDGLPDVWELANGANPVLVDAGEDGDEDGLSNLQEFDAGTDPRNSDSDEDGLSDGEEKLTHYTNPLLADSDGDGYEDGEEVEHTSSPNDTNSIPAYAVKINYQSYARNFSTSGGEVNRGQQFVGSPFSSGIFANSQSFNLYGFYYQVFQPAGSPANIDADGVEFRIYGNQQMDSIPQLMMPRAIWTGMD